MKARERAEGLVERLREEFLWDLPGLFRRRGLEPKMIRQFLVLISELGDIGIRGELGNVLLDQAEAAAQHEFEDDLRRAETVQTNRELALLLAADGDAPMLPPLADERGPWCLFLARALVARKAMQAFQLLHPAEVGSLPIPVGPEDYAEEMRLRHFEPRPEELRELMLDLVDWFRAADGAAALTVVGALYYYHRRSPF